MNPSKRRRWFSKASLGTYDWGHIAMEAHLVPSEFRGQGIKVGIIDTGIQAEPEHEDLRVAKGLNSDKASPLRSERDRRFP